MRPVLVYLTQNSESDKDSLEGRLIYITCQAPEGEKCFPLHAVENSEGKSEFSTSDAIDDGGKKMKWSDSRSRGNKSQIKGVLF